MKKVRVGGHNKNSKLIKYTLIDDIDFHLFKKHKWCVYKGRNTFYAYRKSKECDGFTKIRMIKLHRVILGAPDTMVVDHINGNGLDNRRKNLRLFTTKQNTWNQKRTQRNKTGCIGVVWDVYTKSWKAQIMAHGKNINLGRFKKKSEAVKARRMGEEKYHTI